MKESIIKRVYNEARYILNTKNTIRQTAKRYNVSKSTVHKDLQDRLKRYDINLYNEIKKILDFNYQVRYIRGGESTKKKYAKNVS